MPAVPVIQPEPDPGDAEDPDRVADRLLEQPVEVELAADLRGETAEGVATRGRVLDGLDRQRGRRAAGQPQLEVAAADERLVARPGHGRQAAGEAPRSGGGPRDACSGGALAETEER